MSAFINNGLSGLLAAQRALQVTSNNVANAATDGYVRQRVEFNERPSTFSGGLSLGNGVSISNVRRVYDQFIADELKSAHMSESRARWLSDLSGRLDQLLGNPDRGIGQALQSFINQAEALNRDPTSTVNRQQLLAQGRALGERFAQFDSQLSGLASEVNGRLQESVNRINSLAESLARVNDRLAANAGATPNELLDEQENLLKDLAGLIDFTTTRQDNGTVNVLVGNGQPLVLDVTAFKLGVTGNEFDSSRLEVAYQGQPISSLIGGGEVAGLLAFRSESLDPARRQLGQLALGLTEAFNAQHRKGMDLYGQLGGDFFAGIPPEAIASAGNSGGASVSLSIVDPAATEARDYVLRYNGTAWELRDAATDVAVSLSGSGTAADPFVAQGLAFTVTGSPASGDRFLLSAVRSAPTGVRPVLTDPNAIAAAAPVSARSALANLSDARAGDPQVVDVTDPSLLQAVNIVFDTPGSYRIRDLGGNDLSGPQAWSPGDAISFNGWTVQIAGSPQGGDSFEIRATGAGSGDNGNALALSQIASQGFFNAGQVSLANVSADIVANIGSVAARAESDLAIQTALREQTELDLESVSGVNLDEEAVNLLRYQEAYLAASKIITVANQLFNSLLSAVGR